MLTLDHLLIAADDLQAAKSKCEALGFTVVYGGSERRALNALIFLGDGTLIELIGKDRFATVVSLLHRLRVSRLFGLMIDRIAAFPSLPHGLFNISLHSPDLRATYGSLKKSSIAVSRPTRLSRTRDDGVKISWELIGTAPYDLPFIIGDYAPARLRDQGLARHANGAVGIGGVTIACRDLQRYADVYSRIMQQSPMPTSGGGRRGVTFRLADKAINLVESAETRRGFTSADQSFPESFTLRFGGSGTDPTSGREHLMSRLWPE